MKDGNLLYDYRHIIAAFSEKEMLLKKRIESTKFVNANDQKRLGSQENIFIEFLSSPKDENQGKYESLEVSDISSLPVKSIIEVKIDSVEFNYYRLDNGLWTKVAESRDPFAIEVFSHGTIPIVIDMIQ